MRNTWASFKNIPKHRAKCIDYMHRCFFNTSSQTIWNNFDKRWLSSNNVFTSVMNLYRNWFGQLFSFAVFGKSYYYLWKKCVLLEICARFLPFDTMRCCQYVAVVDQHPSAIEPVEVGQTRHPRIVVFFCWLPTDYSAVIFLYAASWKNKQTRKLLVMLFSKLF